MNMPTLGYSDERNVQLLVALLKAKGIRTVVASPGTTNINFVWSVQRDPFFRVFSAVDERHAAYLACGMAAESGEPIVITCTGATASRNYFPGLTEAHYRKLPILAVTAMQQFTRVGNLAPQALDRTVQPADTVVFSAQCGIPHSESEVRACELLINKALIALRRHGGGPVHINLETSYSAAFSLQALPAVRAIEYVEVESEAWPELPVQKHIGIRIGSHRPFTAEETDALEAFATTCDAAIFVDHTSGYYGSSAVHASLPLSQPGFLSAHPELAPAFLIHLGEVTGDYPGDTIASFAQAVWRVSEDGELRDLTGRLTAVFEMREKTFFQHYAPQRASSGPSTFAKSWQDCVRSLLAKIPELPFSNTWIASQVMPMLPQGCALHLGILNTLRNWNLFPLPEGVRGACNVGGFGIDGILSTALGAALTTPDKLVFTVVGDLAFFYDMNALGNRHLCKNLRILLINNGAGGEFHLHNHPAYQFGEARKQCMAANGHFGNKSLELVRHYATDLGFDYRAASDKSSFQEALSWFLGEADKPLLLECFTTTEDDAEGVDRMCFIEVSAKTKFRHAVGEMLPPSVKKAIKKVLK